MRLLIEHPVLALLPAAVLLALGWWSRSRLTLLAAGLWPAYLIWELIVSEDRPDANIRIDLLVIYPVLVVMTAVGVWTGRRARGTRARKGRDQ
jgi:hypothetical protein